MRGERPRVGGEAKTSGVLTVTSSALNAFLTVWASDKLDNSKGVTGALLGATLGCGRFVES